MYLKYTNLWQVFIDWACRFIIRFWIDSSFSIFTDVQTVRWTHSAGCVCLGEQLKDKQLETTNLLAAKTTTQLEQYSVHQSRSLSFQLVSGPSPLPVSPSTGFSFLLFRTLSFTALLDWRREGLCLGTLGALECSKDDDREPSSSLKQNQGTGTVR